MKLILPHEMRKLPPNCPSWFKIEKYSAKRTASFTYWDWAFQIAIRRSCWNTVKSLEEYHENTDEKALYMRSGITRYSRIEEALAMLMSEPLVTWNLLEKHELHESHFWHLSYLIDNTYSSSPSISIPTIGEIQNLIQSAWHMARTEPERTEVEEFDEALQEMSYGTLDPEYVAINEFLDNDRLVLIIQPGNTARNLREQFEHFIERLAAQGSVSNENPNVLKTDRIASFQILPYLDLKIWSTYYTHRFFEPPELASFLFQSNALAYRIKRQTAKLAEQLLDKDSRESQELLAYAARQRNSEHDPPRRTKRGRRPKASQKGR
jgi:hypothetical protein